MKRKVGFILLIAVAIFIIGFVLYSLLTRQNQMSHNYVANDNIVKIIDFSVRSDSTDLDSSAEGVVFVRAEDGIFEGVRIIARIEVDPDDWGGVGFHIPRNWYISNITNSYHDSAREPSDAWPWLNEGGEWSAWIPFGYSENQMVPTGGGTGTVLIDAVPDKAAIDHSETYHFSIYVGSELRGTTRVVGPDTILIPVSIIDNE